MLRNQIDKIRLLFHKDKESYFCFYKILGFYPRNIQLYQQALLHKSTSIRSEKGRPLNNERLEFLGDAILDAIVGDIVYKHFEGRREGFLTNTRSKIVQRETLNKLAVATGLDKLVKYSTRSSSHNSYMYGNAFEAFIGAIYLDNNYEVAARFILGHLKKFLDLIDQGDYDHDYKSDLQELAQKHGDVDIRYDVVRDEGPDHDKTIWMKIMINGKDFGTGVGKNKKEAAQKAAKEAIERIHKGERF